MTFFCFFFYLIYPPPLSLIIIKDDRKTVLCLHLFGQGQQRQRNVGSDKNSRVSRWRCRSLNFSNEPVTCYHLQFLGSVHLELKDSLSIDILGLCLSQALKETVLRRLKQQDWPSGCTRRPSEWAARRRNLRFGAERGPWFPGRLTLPQDMSAHRQIHKQKKVTNTPIE